MTKSDLTPDESPEEVGARHGEVTGAWRVLRNGLALAVVGMIGAAIVYSLVS